MPPGVTDAVTNWASRRERVTYYAAATLIEFGSSSERDAGAGVLARERAGRADRGRRAVPSGRGRENRPVRPPPPDQLARLSPAARDLRCRRARRRDDGARSGAVGPAGGSRARAIRRPGAAAAHRARTSRRGRSGGSSSVTPASLRRGMSRGMSAAQLVEWYTRRTGRRSPPAVRLLLAAKIVTRFPPLKAARMLVLNLPTAELLDGLLQHPATAPLLGRRPRGDVGCCCRRQAAGAAEGAEGAGDRAAGIIGLFLRLGRRPRGRVAVLINETDQWAWPCRLGVERRK